jgi:hypothetical protein
MKADIATAIARKNAGIGSPNLGNPLATCCAISDGEIDIGFRFIQLLERMGLAWDIQTPEVLPLRPGITPIMEDSRAFFLQSKPNRPSRLVGTSRITGLENGRLFG